MENKDTWNWDDQPDFPQGEKQSDDPYQRLFDFFHNQYGLILLHDEIDNIVNEVNKSSPKIIT